MMKVYEDGYTILQQCKTYECQKGHRFHVDLIANAVDNIGLHCPICKAPAKEVGIVGESFADPDEHYVTLDLVKRDLICHLAGSLMVETDFARDLLDEETEANILAEMERINWRSCLSEKSRKRLDKVPPRMLLL